MCLRECYVSSSSSASLRPRIDRARRGVTKRGGLIATHLNRIEKKKTPRKRTHSLLRNIYMPEDSRNILSEYCWNSSGLFIDKYLCSLRLFLEYYHNIRVLQRYCRKCISAYLIVDFERIGERAFCGARKSARIIEIYTALPRFSRCMLFEQKEIGKGRRQN
jgi:hypothetical protein